MFPSFRKRSTELERIDTGDYTAEEYEGSIVDLQRINKWVGDARALKGSLLEDVARSSQQSFSVLDVGAGSGELLRVVAAWAREEKRHATLVGLELNTRSAQAIAEDKEHGLIAVQADAFKLPFVDGTFDYTISSLFTHHFTDDKVPEIFREMSRVAKRGIFVIDLLRHPIAYMLYRTLGPVLLTSRLTQHDGSISILRGFRSEELKQLAARAGLVDITVERRFPFRLVLSARKPTAKSQACESEPEKIRLAS